MTSPKRLSQEEERSLERRLKAQDERALGEALGMAMLSGVDFYRAHGYAPGALVQYELEPGLSIEFLPMSKVV